MSAAAIVTEDGRHPFGSASQPCARSELDRFVHLERDDFPRSPFRSIPPFEHGLRTNAFGVCRAKKRTPFFQPDLPGRAFDLKVAMTDLSSAMFVLTLSAVLLVAGQQFLLESPEVAAATSTARPNTAARSLVSYVR